MSESRSAATGKLGECQRDGNEEWAGRRRRHDYKGAQRKLGGMNMFIILIR